MAVTPCEDTEDQQEGRKQLYCHGLSGQSVVLQLQRLRKPGSLNWGQHALILCNHRDNTNNYQPQHLVYRQKRAPQGSFQGIAYKSIVCQVHHKTLVCKHYLTTNLLNYGANYVFSCLVISQPLQVQMSWISAIRARSAPKAKSRV